jgi:cyclopropane fatty-acyl-phospholipid synthase-like methyltransferase
MNKAKVDAFWRSRLTLADPRIATSFRRDGRLQYDLQLVTEHLPPGAHVLDLGAGTCTLATALLDCVASVVAVDKYAEFLSHAAPDPRLHTVQADVVEFMSRDRFDVILLFGVVNSLDTDDETQLYGHCRDMLSAGGVVLVKHQCGLREPVIIDKYSEELGGHYHARYPAVDEQAALLGRFFEVHVLDMYPDAINRWPDTRFFAFVCRQKS